MSDSKNKNHSQMATDISHMGANSPTHTTLPDTTYSARELFGLDTDWEIPGFSEDHANVPEIDESYQFDHDTTMAILAGFAHNRRVMVQGYHGTGKSTHVEQVAARLKWPCVRINLDSHVSRLCLLYTSPSPRD